MIMIVVVLISKGIRNSPSASIGTDQQAWSLPKESEEHDAM
jgi:hypothetical protein